MRENEVDLIITGLMMFIAGLVTGLILAKSSLV